MAWICCQRGAREHYSIPRALHRKQALELLLTDYWQLPGELFAHSLGRMNGRYHSELREAQVKSFNSQTVCAEVRQRIFRSHWFVHQQRLNRQFQDACIKVLRGMADEGPRTVFAFSYAAKEILAYARTRGWQTVLGQIDPGPRESEIVMEEHRRHGWEIGETYQPPAGYWADWRMETELADRIVANSKWSVRCLREAGIPDSKLEIIPCAYETNGQENFSRSYPDAFTPARPLEVLFLGQTLVRKGIHTLIETAALMKKKDELVRFTVAGGDLEHLPLTISANIYSVGPVPRESTPSFYRQADIFVLPTLSDGFALTQLEAMAWGLPVVTTGRCGEVVIDNLNGIILADSNAATLAAALRRLIANPGLLKELSSKTAVSSQFSLDEIGHRLIEVAT